MHKKRKFVFATKISIWFFVETQKFNKYTEFYQLKLWPHKRAAGVELDSDDGEFDSDDNDPSGTMRARAVAFSEPDSDDNDVDDFEFSHPQKSLAEQRYCGCYVNLEGIHYFLNIYY